MNPFSFEALWNKSKIFIERGLRAREDERPDEWALWASLAAEILGKAVLAKRHPALVADPNDEGALSLLAATGAIQVDEYSVRSIMMKTVMARLAKLIPSYDSTVQHGLKLLTDMRNADLHSGATPFVALKESSWAPAFWRAIDAMLRDIGKTVVDFVGKGMAGLVTELIADAESAVRAEVKAAIADAKRRWEVRAADDGGEEARRKRIDEQVANARHWPSDQIQECPICGCDGVLSHNDTIISKSRKARNDYSVAHVFRYRADSFHCDGCSLEVDGTQKLALHGLPIEIASELTPEEKFDEEYGNC